MAYHIERYESDHPDYKRFEDASLEVQCLLQQAEERKYIRIYRAPNGKKYYDEEILQQAQMWKDKGCLGMEDKDDTGLG